MTAEATARRLVADWLEASCATASPTARADLVARIADELDRNGRARYEAEAHRRAELILRARGEMFT